MRFFILFLSFSLISDEFKSWDAKFKFTHYSAGNITLKRSFKFDDNEITSRFVLRPLFIYEYSQKSSLVLESNKVVGEEVIKKKFGNINCIKVKATSNDAGDITYYISPEYDFMIIDSFIELRNGKINKLSLVDEPKFLEE